MQNKLLKLCSVVVLAALVVATSYPVPKAHAVGLTRLQASNGKNTTFASSVKTTAFVSALTNPSIIVCAAEYDSLAANAGNTPTDTAGNTWTKVLSKAAGSAGVFDLEVWYALNTHTTASEQVTMTDTGGGVDSTAVCEEWSGNATVSPIDQSASGNDGGTAVTAMTSGASAATTNTNDAVLGFGVAAISGNHLTLGSGYTNLNQTSTTFSNIGSESKTVSATGAQTATMTVSTASSYVMAVVAIKDNSGGGGGGGGGGGATFISAWWW